jgi:DNA-binding transcriptional LysR family regulator|tara:strand:+ start:340 stop:1242 length:903 start_codon:yes stop_codon:yes gene_type:complete
MQNLRIYKYVDKIAQTGSIRQAAEQLYITPSALNRRLIALEQELGVKVFERLGRGVRLSTAGELFIDHIRKHLSETEKLKSQIEDLSGLRRGHVTIACTQAALPFFIPNEIQKYQEKFPHVNFSVLNKDGTEAAIALLNHTADIALVFDQLRQSDFQTAYAIPQSVHAIMSKSHYLASKSQVSISECLNYPLALPTQKYGLRKTLENIFDKLLTRITPTIEADSYVFLQNYISNSNAIGFELEIGMPQKNSNSLISRPVKLPQDTSVLIYINHLRNRNLPIAASKFALQLADTLQNLEDA